MYAGSRHRSGRRHRVRAGRREPAVKTAAGACAGAALALLLVTRVETWQVLVAVVVAVVLGTVLVKEDKPVERQPVREPVQPKPAHTSPPQLRVVLEAPPSGQWWTKTSPA